MGAFSVWGRLSPPARRGLLVHALQWQAVQVGSLFTSVYLFRLGGGYRLPALYALFSYAAVPAGYWLAAHLARTRGSGAALRSGLAVFALAQALVLGLGTGAADWVLPLGLLWGLGVGLYWQAWVLLIVDLTDEHEDRDRMLGANQACYFIAGLSGVPLAGAWITWAGGTRGYGAVFAAVLALFVAAWWLSLPLAGRPQHGSSALGRLLRARKPAGWAAGMWSAVATGLLSVGSQFLPMLLSYDVGGDEGHGGVYTAFTAFAGFVTASLVARLGHPERRGALVGWSALAVCLLTLPLALLRSYSMVLVYGLGMAVSMSVYNMPLFAAQIRIIEADRHFRHRRGDALFLRELPLAAGRITACAAVLWGAAWRGGAGMSVLLGVLAATPLLCYAVLRDHLSGPRAISDIAPAPSGVQNVARGRSNP